LLKSLAVTLAGAAAGSTAGAAAAFNADANNRQLHPRETKAIVGGKKRFALEQGITEAEAEQRLADQANRQVKFGIPGWDSAAEKFLSRLAGGEGLLPGDLDAGGLGQNFMFRASAAERLNSNIYLSALRNDPEAAQFYLRHDLKDPTLDQMLQAAVKDYNTRTNIGFVTKILGIFSNGLIVGIPAATALGPATAAEMAELARLGPVLYCGTRPGVCTVAAETAICVAAGEGCGPNSISTEMFAARASQKALRETFVDLAGSLRAKLPGSSSTMGNIGIATVDVPGLPKYVAASSRIDSPTADQAALGLIGLGPEVFPSAVVNLPPPGNFPLLRNVDTEAKILNNIATQLGENRSAAGAITLFTERQPCSSCSNVIDLFRQKYPNIRVVVIDNANVVIKPH
jgi:hypothetical protein